MIFLVKIITELLKHLLNWSFPFDLKETAKVRIKQLVMIFMISRVWCQSFSSQVWAPYSPTKSTRLHAEILRTDGLQRGPLDLRLSLISVFRHFLLGYFKALRIVYLDGSLIHLLRIYAIQNFWYICFGLIIPLWDILFSKA